MVFVTERIAQDDGATFFQIKSGAIWQQKS